ncbi:hypothetical protein FVO59_07880 [Microbacterium esteraromaticum]|uniref:Uncharacterized protein n=1 Tax=Microbacterium esteraromaticum TaxID=57043 RepID=A0A7D7WID9_9MICO|nr:hypothetical protein [Microbacterium esteraromaticum]QMU97150.1 hypothetical protein FVO59_07880 [Microbacterium esteraromaticum]
MAIVGKGEQAVRTVNGLRAFGCITATYGSIASAHSARADEDWTIILPSGGNTAHPISADSATTIDARHVSAPPCTWNEPQEHEIRRAVRDLAVAALAPE